MNSEQIRMAEALGLVKAQRRRVVRKANANERLAAHLDEQFSGAPDKLEALGLEPKEIGGTNPAADSAETSSNESKQDAVEMTLSPKAAKRKK